MRRILSILIVSAVVCLGLFAADGQKTLIAYFSRTGENYNVGYIEKGNTAIVAEIIQVEVGGDLFEISTVHSYPEEYRQATAMAQQEKGDKARPELRTNINTDEYDVIFLGYPIWWADLPMAMYTFLESHDFTGKTIIPFCTHEGSRLSGTERTIRNTTGADVLNGLAIRGSVAQNERNRTRTEVISWLEGLGL